MEPVPIRIEHILSSLDCPVRLIHRRNGRVPSCQRDASLIAGVRGIEAFRFVARWCLVGGRYPDSSLPMASLEESRLASGWHTLSPIKAAGFEVDIDLLHSTPDAIEIFDIVGSSIYGLKAMGSYASDLLPAGHPDARGWPQLITLRGEPRAVFRASLLRIACMTYVIEQALSALGDDRPVRPRIVMLNRLGKDSRFDLMSNVDVRGESAVFRQVPPQDWRSQLVSAFDVNEEVAHLRSSDAMSRSCRWAGLSLNQILMDVTWLWSMSDREPGRMAVTERGWKCRKCEFRTEPRGDSGFAECWWDESGKLDELLTLYRGDRYSLPGSRADGRWVHEVATADPPIGLVDLTIEGESPIEERQRRQQRSLRDGSVVLEFEGRSSWRSRLGVESRRVAVFISSTFRDFEEERELIVNRVFPELARRGRERAVEIIPIDLRVGITESQSTAGLTLPICLQEIERASPYFIGLLGERYGWIPEPDLYPDDLLAREPWLKEHAGGASVTELEIIHGVLNDPEGRGQATFYFREAGYAEVRGGEFVSTGDVERARLERLKKRVRRSLHPVVEYERPTDLVDLMINDIWAKIDAQYPAESVPDENARGSQADRHFARVRSRGVVGRLQTQARLFEILEESSGDANPLIVVTGPPGIGKTAFLARAAETLRRRHPRTGLQDYYVDVRPSSSDLRFLLGRMSHDCLRLVAERSGPMEVGAEKPGGTGTTLFSTANDWAETNGRDSVIFIDGLERIEHIDDLGWLPDRIPPGLKVVVSARRVSGSIKDQGRSLMELPLAHLRNADVERYVRNRLRCVGRGIEDRHLARILDHRLAGLPAFLRPLCDELDSWGSRESLDARVVEILEVEEVGDLFGLILERLETESDVEGVRAVLLAIWASGGWLSESILREFTGVTPLAYALVRHRIRDGIVEGVAGLDYACSYLRESVRDRYLRRSEDRRELHERLLAWWEARSDESYAAEAIRHHMVSLGTLAEGESSGKGDGI